MRLGQTEKYTVEDVVFEVCMAWKPRRDHLDAQRAARAKPDMEPSEQDALNDAREKAALDLIGATVRRVGNLVGEDGQPVTEWSEELAYELPEPVIEELLDRIINYRSDERLGEVPTAEKPSPSPPATTTAESP